MLNLEAAIVLPVVENLTAQNMSSHVPDTLPTLFCKPLVINQLCVKVFDLIRGVMQVRFLHLRRRTLHEENVVISVLVATIQMHEGHDIDVGKVPVVEDIGWHKVEIIRVPLELCIEVAMNISEVAQLVYQSWTVSEPLEFASVGESSINANSSRNVEVLLTFSRLLERRIDGT